MVSIVTRIAVFSFKLDDLMAMAPQMKFSAWARGVACVGVSVHVGRALN
jgi:hypothetical protein